MPNIPRPNTYIKIKDIEQLKLLCEYKNNKVRPYVTYKVEVEQFLKGNIYFRWDKYGDGFTTSYNSDELNSLGYTEIIDDSFLYPTKKPMDKSPNPKKEKQEIFDNQFKVGQYVWFYDEGKVSQKEIVSINKGPSYCVEYDCPEGKIFLDEGMLFKTKSQLIKSLSKQWRQEVEDRILSLTK